MIETPSIGSIEGVVLVADILPYYFLLANTAALLTEGPLQLYSTQHTTAQHKVIISTPNPTTAQLAGGKRSYDVCHSGILCHHGELCSDTLVGRLSSLPCLDLLLQDDFVFLENIFPIVVAHAQQYCCAYGNAPLQDSRTKADIHFEHWNESGSRASPAVLLWLYYYPRRHTPTTTNRPRARSSYIDFYIDSLLIFSSWINLCLLNIKYVLLL